MFPFTNSISYLVDIAGIVDFKKEQHMDSFADQLKVQRKESSTLMFKNFNVFYKRHKGLDNGTLEITDQDKNLKLN